MSSFARYSDTMVFFRAIVSDCDPRFTSLFWKSLFKSLGTKLSMSTAFHPATNGQTERMNRTIQEMLRHYAVHKPRDWDKQLVVVEFAYNNSVQASTGFTPFKLATGKDPLVPSSFLLPSSDKQVAVTDEFLRTLETQLRQAKDAIQHAQRKQQEYANRSRRELSFEEGESVMLSTEDLNITYPPSRKLVPRFIGPFKIKYKKSPLVYELELPANMKVHPVFHVSKLKPFHESDEQEFPERDQGDRPPPPIIAEDGHEEYEVEKILDKRVKGRQVQYLVKWKGYEDYDSTWEPLRNLKNCAEAIKEFEDRSGRNEDVARS